MSRTCTRLTGTWTDPYTARVFNKAADVDIDNVVSLADAYRSGARTWTTTQRTGYANDPLVVVTTWDKGNVAKSDRGPATWRPANAAARCPYAERWVAVKAKYHLNTTAPDRTAITRMLRACR